MEMLGQDTCILRTYLQVGNEILSDLNSNVTGNVDKRKELVQKNDNDIGIYIVWPFIACYAVLVCSLVKAKLQVTGSYCKTLIYRVIVLYN